MSSKREKIKWHSYLVFLWPLLGLAIVFAYLSIFSIYRRWDIVLEKQNATSIRTFFIDHLASLGKNLNVTTLGADPGQTLANTITAKNAVVWGYATGLVAVALLLAIIISGYTIWNGPRRETDSKSPRWTNRKRWLLTAGLLLFSLVLYPLITYGLTSKFTVVARHLWEVINTQFIGQGSLINFINVEILVVTLSYAVSILLVCASASTLWPLRELELPDSALTPKKADDAASHVSQQMKYLRWVLYIGAVLLVLITFRHKITMQWALEYMKPHLLFKAEMLEPAKILYANLESLISNNLTGTSVFNTLLLAGIYVPSALVLQSRATRLSQLAIRLESERATTAKEVDETTVVFTAPVLRTKQEEWIKSYGLSHPIREQLPKVVAIVSPLLAGPIGELLNFFK